MRWMAILAVSAVVAGCSGRPTTPPTGQDVALTMTASPPSGDAQHAVTITADVTNAAGQTLYRHWGCSWWTAGMSLSLIDPQSRTVLLWSPRDRPLCADGFAAFAPREHFQGTAQFTGALFTTDGTPIAATTGTYTAVVQFETWTDSSLAAPPVPHESRTTFHWSAP